ncbi:MAG: CDP-diacylglycerol--glycerol-3-phosphate 3-phosphatidyltransferase [Syntrophus sp. (in: bacteria)]|nr:CDP-diacylglycerol--glycerol-3-phosphate 3-phosphatidyltransferase [Syntrophus sp. (in: bacteria)]
MCCIQEPLYRKMNIPNLLSIFRLFLTIFFVAAIMQGRYRTALYLFILQGLTDLLDGFLARAMNKKTSLGAFLDPVADKAMLVSAYVVLSVYNIIPLWVTMVILLKDLTVACGFLGLYKLFGMVKLVPTIFGKASTFCQIFTVVYVLWSISFPAIALPRDYQSFFFYVTAILTVIAGIQYVTRGFRILLKKEAV